MAGAWVVIVLPHLRRLCHIDGILEVYLGSWVVLLWLELLTL